MDIYEKLTISFPSTKKGSWKVLSEEEKWRWLSNVSNHYFSSKKRVEHKKAMTFQLDGMEVDDLPSFYALLGETINGANGYFGNGLDNMYDCFFGGFGFSNQDTLIITNAHHLQEVLSTEVLINDLNHSLQWVEKAMEEEETPEDYVDPLFEDMKRRILTKKIEALKNRPTYFDSLRKTIFHAQKHQGFEFIVKD